MATLEPYLNRVIVEKMPEEEQTPSGIWIPPEAQRTKPCVKAKVVAVGPGSRNMETGEFIGIPNVQPGDIIVTRHFVAEHIDIDGVEHGIIHDNDIIGIVRE